MQKRTFLSLLTLSIALMFVLAACGGNAPATTTEAPAEAAATEAPAEAAATEAPAEEAAATEAPAEEAAATEAPAEEAAATEAPAEEAAATEAPAEEAAATEAPAEEAAATEAPAEEAAGDAALSGARTFVVVPEASTASYVVNEEFLAQALEKLGIEAGQKVIVGSTNNVEGELTIDLDAKTIGDNRFVVDMTTLSTDQNRRDNWIRENGPRFNQFPQAQFVATGIEDAPESYTEGEEVAFRLLGDLTVRDVTIPVTFDVTAAINGDTLTGVAESNLRISDFGIDPPSFVDTLTVADPFVVRMELTAQAQ